MEPDAHTTLSRRVALVDAAGEPGSPTALVLADLAEALPVYARLAHVAAPELVGAGGLAGCDAVLLALPAEGGVVPALPRGARIYVIAIAPTHDPAPARERLNAERARCEALGARWMGGLALGGAEMATRVTSSPRMGWLRRRASEAADRLLMALLAGEPVAEEDVAPPLPRALYWLVYERGDRSA